MNDYFNQCEPQAATTKKNEHPSTADQERIKPLNILDARRNAMEYSSGHSDATARLCGTVLEAWSHLGGRGDRESGVYAIGSRRKPDT